MSALPKVLCNSGPLMALGKLNRLDLLADVFEQVGITSGVFEEVVTKGIARGAQDAFAVRLFWHHVNWPSILFKEVIPFLGQENPILSMI